MFMTAACASENLNWNTFDFNSAFTAGVALLFGRSSSSLNLQTPFLYQTAYLGCKCLENATTDCCNLFKLAFSVGEFSFIILIRKGQVLWGEVGGSRPTGGSTILYFLHILSWSMPESDYWAGRHFYKTHHGCYDPSLV